MVIQSGNLLDIVPVWVEKMVCKSGRRALGRPQWTERWIRNRNVKEVTVRVLWASVDEKSLGSIWRTWANVKFTQKLFTWTRNITFHRNKISSLGDETCRTGHINLLNSALFPKSFSFRRSVHIEKFLQQNAATSCLLMKSLHQVDPKHTYTA